MQGWPRWLSISSVDPTDPRWTRCWRRLTPFGPSEPRAVGALVSRPVGGILSTGPSRESGWVTIHLCGLPEECPEGRTGRPRPLLGLAPGGGCHPPGSPPAMVRSYRTVSPLPVPTPRGRPSAVCSLLPDPSDRSDLALASTLPCGVPTFLDGTDPEVCAAAATRTTHQRSQCASTRPPRRTCSGHAVRRPVGYKFGGVRRSCSGQVVGRPVGYKFGGGVRDQAGQASSSSTNIAELAS